MKKLLLILGLALLVPSTALAAGNPNEVLGPVGYAGPPKATTVVAGTANVTLTSGDHVVICHAIGGPNGTRFIQIAPSAGVAAGHVGHEGARDIIPPFSIKLGASDNVNTDAASGQNWNTAGQAIYNNGCRVPGDTTPPPVVPTCPEGTDLVDTVEVEGNVVGVVCLKTVTNTVTNTVERVVERIVEKPVVVEKIVYKDRVVIKTRTKVITKYRTKTVVKYVYKTRVVRNAPKPRSVPFTP